MHPLRLVSVDQDIQPRRQVAPWIAAALMIVASLAILIYTAGIISQDARAAAAELHKATEDMKREREAAERSSQHEDALRRQAVNQAAEIFVLREQLKKLTQGSDQ